MTNTYSIFGIFETFHFETFLTKSISFEIILSLYIVEVLLPRDDMDPNFHKFRKEGSMLRRLRVVYVRCIKF